MVDPERFFYRKIKTDQQVQKKDRVSHKQKSSLLRHVYGRGGPPVDIQFKDRVSYKKGASILRLDYGKGVEGATKAMRPAPRSQGSSSSEDSDSPFDFSQNTSKTKVIVRCLPPSLSEKSFKDSISPRFDGLFKWISFCPGKTGIKSSSYSRVYIDLKSPEDVFKFYEEFNGHVFVNEKGTRYKASVEYAPNQKVPKPSPEKDQEEGSISEDPKYLEFQHCLSLPIPLLPSAEVQLERKEAEKRSSLEAAKKTVIVTPLMKFVRQKRVLRAQCVVVATGKKSAHRGSLSTVVTKAPDISRGSCKYAFTTWNPSEKTLVPGRCHEPSQLKKFTKREAVFEDVSKVVMKEKGLDKMIQIDRKFGGSTNSGSRRQMRKEGGSGKKSKQMGDVRRHEKSVWVAKSASGS